MRIITGKARGRRLVTPDGQHTRPTGEKVKEAIFNIVQFDIEGRRALDLFCGGGQLGLEAVSRGAERCVFVDNDRAAQQAAERNIRTCGFEKQCRLVRGDVAAFLKRQKSASFGLIFLDPPYGGEILKNALNDIFAFDILQTGGIMVCESAVSDVLPPPGEGYALLREYRYGKTKLTTYARE